MKTTKYFFFIILLFITIQTYCEFLMLKKRNIIITIVDKKNFHLLENQILFSFKRFHISYPLVYVFDKELLQNCFLLRIRCIYYDLTKITNLRINNLAKKYYVKYFVMYENIKKGYNVLFVDTDVLFLYNCMKDIWKRNEDIIMLKSQLSKKISFGNAGFMLIKSNNRIIEMMNEGIELINKNYKKYHIHDQTVFTILINKYKNVKSGLFKNKYKVGLNYIENCIF